MQSIMEMHSRMEISFFIVSPPLFVGWKAFGSVQDHGNILTLLMCWINKNS